MKKSCPTCQGYPTYLPALLPELSLPPRQLEDIHINSCLNYSATQGKVNSPRATRGEGCLGYPRPCSRDHINGALPVNSHLKTEGETFAFFNVFEKLSRCSQLFAQRTFYRNLKTILPRFNHQKLDPFESFVQDEN